MRESERDWVLGGWVGDEEAPPNLSNVLIFNLIPQTASEPTNPSSSYIITYFSAALRHSRPIPLPPLSRIQNINFNNK